jgi:hypothetical protein
MLGDALSIDTAEVALMLLNSAELSQAVVV